MNYELKLGDTLEKMKEIPDGSIDMVLCDLPYGTTACKWDTVIPFEPLWEAYRRVLSTTGTVVLTAAQPFTSVVVCSNLQDFKYAWIWEKNRPTLPHHAKNRPMAKHEDILVFSLGKMGHAVQVKDRRMTYNPQGMVAGKKKVVSAKGSHSSITGARPNQVGIEYVAMTNAPHTILRFDKEEDHVHPTQKPVALMEYLVKTYTNSGELVLDNTMGSGTTGVACMNTGRRFIGIERDEAYFAICRERIHRAYVDSIDI
jgi:site-specific DNA-methyltransferase (adenine-specific)